MLKLLRIDPHLADFDGDIRGLKRTGFGVQKLGEFGTISARFVENVVQGSVEFRCAQFPLKFTADVDGDSLSNQKLDVDSGRVGFDGDLGPGLNPLRGVFSFEDGINIHLIIESSQFAELSLTVHGESVDLDSHIRRNTLFFPELETGLPVVTLHRATGVLTYGRYNKNESPEGKWIEIGLFSGLFSIKTYEKEQLVGPLTILDFQQDVPSVKIKGSSSDVGFLKVTHADGRVTTSEEEGGLGVLRVTGLNTYIVGPLKDGQLEGKSSLFVDGKLKVDCSVESNVLSTPSIPSLFAAMEGHSKPDEPRTLNGFCEYDFQNGLVYNGFFENDFLYCHKNAFSACIRDRERNREFNLIRFQNRVKWFDGTLEGFRAMGVCRAKYKDGGSYSGHFDQRFLRDGKGQLLETDGTFYLGSFKDDLFHGFGRLFTKDKVTWGIWEKGILKLEIDVNNLNVDDIRDLDNLAEYLNGGMSLEEVQMTLGLKRAQKMGGSLEGYFGQMDRKRLGANKEALNQKSELLAMVTIFHFKNGFAYHGKVVGNYILDKDVGDIITPQGERIRSRYKAMPDLNMGAFKSLDERHFFMFNYDKKMLGEVELDEKS
jgi:hypothetical protein